MESHIIWIANGRGVSEGYVLYMDSLNIYAKDIIVMNL